MKLGALLVAIVLTGLIPHVASAGHAVRRGSFDARLIPTGYYWTSCYGAPAEGINQLTHPLTAPFEGNLHVELSGFEGDWHIAVLDGSGNVIAYAFGELGEPAELDVAVRAREELAIRACNFAGGPDAHVEYVLSHQRLRSLRPSKVKRIRTVEWEYTQPTYSTSFTGGICYEDGCQDFYVGPDDRSVTIKIADGSGLPVAASITPFSGASERGRIQVCSDDLVKFPLRPDTTHFQVWLYRGPCADGTPALGTTGNVTVRFSNQPLGSSR